MRALRLSPNGPEFPGEFVDSLLAGEMVFLCGTGVSAPQMPNFRRLVLRTYETLGVMKDDSEKRAFKKEHFEEVLGSLNRRLSDSQAMIRAVCRSPCSTAKPGSPTASHHPPLVSWP